MVPNAQKIETASSEILKKQFKNSNMGQRDQ